MAWIDDRIWCHPKLTDLSSPAFRAYINGLAYSAGMGTNGRLTIPQQRLVGATAPIRRELVSASLWISETASSIAIHDWDTHNGKRDARRKLDRERKRAARAKTEEMSAGQSTGQSNGTSPGQSAGTSAGTAHVDGSEGSEGKPPYPNPAVDAPTEPPTFDYDAILKDMPL